MPGRGLRKLSGTSLGSKLAQLADELEALVDRSRPCRGARRSTAPCRWPRDQLAGVPALVAVVGRDDLGEERPGRLEVVVVAVHAAVGEALGLRLVEDAGGHGHVEAGLVADDRHQLEDALHACARRGRGRPARCRTRWRPSSAVSRAACEHLVGVEERRRLHRRVELRRLAAEVAVLGAAAGLDRQDALDLDGVTAAGQAHVVRQRHEVAQMLRGQVRQRRHLVEGEPARLVDEPGASGNDELVRGRSVGSGGDDGRVAHVVLDGAVCWGRAYREAAVESELNVSWARSAEAAGDDVRLADRWREIRTLSSGGVHTTLPDGRSVLQFASNDYLGLSSHPAVVAAAIEATEQFGAGSGASRLVVGSRPPHDELEAALADWKHAEAALLFPTGYGANVGVLGALARLGATSGSPIAIVSDELNHASIIDGTRLARVPVSVYRHNDVEMASAAIAAHARDGRRSVIVTDSVFSMDGDVAPLTELAEVASATGALLVVDDAHAVFAGHGADLIGASLDPAVEMLVVGTLSKTLGSVGGFVAGPRSLVEWCRNTARSFIFSTARAGLGGRSGTRRARGRAQRGRRGTHGRAAVGGRALRSGQSERRRAGGPRRRGTGAGRQRRPARRGAPRARHPPTNGRRRSLTTARRVVRGCTRSTTSIVSATPARIARGRSGRRHGVGVSPVTR